MVSPARRRACVEHVVRELVVAGGRATGAGRGRAGTSGADLGICGEAGMKGVNLAFARAVRSMSGQREVRKWVLGRKAKEFLVPGEGIEPPTFGLQNRCTTAVLTRPMPVAA